MARRKRMYGKRRRINYKRIFLLIGLIVILILLVARIFRKDSYISKVEEALNSEITQLSGAISSVSKVDTRVYENDGIRYTNQHENIRKLMIFDRELSDDMDKAGDVKILLENLLKSQETETLDELPAKDEGYYWIEADLVAENKILIFNKENEYNFDLYYHMENETIYVKEKYFHEFSKKYNKTKFQGYQATDEFVAAMEEIKQREIDNVY